MRAKNGITSQEDKLLINFLIEKTCIQIIAIFSTHTPAKAPTLLGFFIYKL